LIKDNEDSRQQTLPFNNYLYFCQVKFIAIIFSVIVLALTIVPCCAVGENVSHIPPSLQYEQHQEAEHQGDDQCKGCSPFYVCGSCAGFTVTNLFALQFTPHTGYIRHESLYLSADPGENFASIWQPPKLS
jgi:hypothetical protein